MGTFLFPPSTLCCAAAHPRPLFLRNACGSPQAGGQTDLPSRGKSVLVPAGHISTWGHPRVKNRLYYGDNLDILRRTGKGEIASESVDLCYIDPPFNSKRNYFQIYNNRVG